MAEGKRGRSPRNPVAMLKTFVVMVLKGYSECGLETFLRNYPFWNRLCRFKGKPPCHATFSNFKRRIGEDTLEKVMKDPPLGVLLVCFPSVDYLFISVSLFDCR